jgi:hypothetical protein
MASADISNPQTFNRYAYVGNNPINITDPTGMIWASNGSIIKWFDNAADMTKGFTEYTSLIGQVGSNYVVLNPNAGTYQQVANAAQALREVAALVGAGGAVFAASATSLGVPLVIAGAYIAAMSTAGPIDATMDDCMSCGRMIQNHVNMMNKKADELEAQVNQANKSATSQAATGNPNDPQNNKPQTQPDKTAGELITNATLKKSPSYRSEMMGYTKSELQKMARDRRNPNSPKAKQTLKLIEQDARLMEQQKNKGRF